MWSFDVIKKYTILLVLMILTTAVFGQAKATVPQDGPLKTSNKVSRQVLAFYYGWYGTPKISKQWIHWENVDTKNKRIGNTVDYPRIRVYDSHDRKTMDMQCRWAREAGVSGFIVNWESEGDFQDKGFPALLRAARKHKLSVTA